MFCEKSHNVNSGLYMAFLPGSAPRISRAPRDLSNYTGHDIVFGCEVSAFPLPNLSWRKKGSDNFLPGDDPHISVQV